MSKLSFKTTHQEQDPLIGQLTAFELDDEDYIALRPKEEGFLHIVQASATMASLPDRVNGVMQFLDLCFKPDDLSEALDELEQHELDELMESGRPANAAVLAMSGHRLHTRLMDRKDDLRIGDLVDVMSGLVEAWTGKAPGQPRDYLPPSKRTGGNSTGRSRSKASTGSRSGTPARRTR